MSSSETIPTSSRPRMTGMAFTFFVRMRTKNVKAMPVMRGRELVGMVSLEDISEVYALLSAAGTEFIRRVPKEPRPAEERSKEELAAGGNGKGRLDSAISKETG